MTIAIDFQPNEETQFNGSGPVTASGVPTNTAGNRYTNVNEIVLDEADYVQLAVSGTPGFLTHDWRANIGSGALANRIITGVEVVIQARRTAGTAGPVVYPQFVISGTALPAFAGDFPSYAEEIAATSTSYAFMFEENPATSDPWTAAEIELFDTTDEIRTEIFAGIVSTLRLYRYIFRVHVEDQGWGAIPLGF